MSLLCLVSLSFTAKTKCIRQGQVAGKAVSFAFSFCHVFANEVKQSSAFDLGFAVYLENVYQR